MSVLKILALTFNGDAPNLFPPDPPKVTSASSRHSSTSAAWRSSGVMGGW